MQASHGELLMSDTLTFAEAPRWHRDRLWVSDFYSRTVQTVTLGGERETVARFDDTPSGLGFTPEGDLLVVLMHSRTIVKVREGRISPHADLSALTPAEINDLVVDRRGRAYVSPYGFDVFGGGQPCDTPLIIVEPDGRPWMSASRFFTPNGMTITPDGKHLTVNETYRNRVMIADIAEDGDIREPRVLAGLPADQQPDGAAIDAESGVWAATIFGGEFVRAARDGTITHRIPAAGTAAIACALGGPDGTTLFLISSRITLEELAEASRHPESVSTGQFGTVVTTARAPYPAAR